MMKYNFILLFTLLTILIGCQNNAEKETDTEATTETGNATEQVIDMSNATTQTLEGGQAATGVKPDEKNAHFICEKFCKGSGSETDGNCPVCGTKYKHNDAFHKNDPPPAVSQMPQGNNAQMTMPEQPKPKPGVFHFICPDNHAGGAEAAGKCAKCSKELIHNDKYHQ